MSLDETSYITLQFEIAVFFTTKNFDVGRILVLMFHREIHNHKILKVILHSLLSLFKVWLVS